MWKWKYCNHISLCNIHSRFFSVFNKTKWVETHHNHHKKPKQTNHFPKFAQLYYVHSNTVVKVSSSIWIICLVRYLNSSGKNEKSFFTYDICVFISRVQESGSPSSLPVCLFLWTWNGCWTLVGKPIDGSGNCLFFLKMFINAILVFGFQLLDLCKNT